MKKFLVAMLASLGASAAVAQVGKDPFDACRADTERLCKHVRPPDGSKVRCMMDNRESASPACAAVLRQKYEKEPEWKARKARQERNLQAESAKSKK